MKRILRKVASILVATAMVAMLGMTALADETLPSGGVTGSKTSTLTTTLVIKKELKVYNPSAEKVYGPNVTYTYSIAASSAGKEITDADGVKTLTKAGVGSPTITGSLSWSSASLVDAAAAGKSNTQDIEIDFATVEFPGAGVYRYKITEQCSGKEAAGVIGSADDVIRYLDVYVRDGDQAGEFIIYGYVLFVNDSDINGSDSGNNLESVVKTQGFVETTSGSTTIDADSYYTYNVTVSKKLENDTANEDNAFPFTVTFEKPAAFTGSFKLDVDGTATDMADSLTAAIKHNASVTYTGIPCGTTVGISEKNKVTGKIYYVTTSGAQTDLANAVLEPDATTDAVTVTTTKGEAGEDKTVEFTNTYVLISPTGVAMAVLPFVILLGFGIGFMVISTTKRKEEQA